MLDERKPVICPWCGGEMTLMVEEAYEYHYKCYSCEACAPTAITEDAAYAAATCTPPNRPLTLPELFDLDGNADAVWVVDSGCGTVVMGAEEASEWASDADTVLFFAHKPTPEDIEAARKERDT